MSELISGKEAKKLWADGESIEFMMSNGEWGELYPEHELGIFDRKQFRLKPQTITLNGIEVPAPFKPEEGETYWYIWDSELGYSFAENRLGYRVGIAAWRTEEEIEQVVAALRSVFGCLKK